MVAATTRLEPSLEPLALIICDDENVGPAIVSSLKNKGFRIFSIQSILGDTESLDGLRPDVIVLDARQNMFAVAKTLVELSKRPLSPPVVLVVDADEAVWLAARFQLLTIRPDTNPRELLRTVERSRREALRAVAPT
jgi:AmiR/NasT family two-component response regulator